MKLIVSRQDILPSFTHIKSDELELHHFSYDAQKLTSYVDIIMFHDGDYKKVLSVNVSKSKSNQSTETGIVYQTQNSESLGGKVL